MRTIKPFALRISLTYLQKYPRYGHLKTGAKMCYCCDHFGNRYSKAIDFKVICGSK